MKVTFRVNLGLIDAKAMKLDVAECKAGMTADIDNATAQTLLKRGIVVRDTDAGKDELLVSLREAEVKAIAKKPELKGVAS